MKFSEVVAQTLEWLQRDGRVSYRALKREFIIDDDYLEDLKVELIDAKRLAVDEDGKVLVWKGSLASSVQRLEPKGQEQVSILQTRDSRREAAERRQLTVMFCDLVGSTALSAQLDPEDYHRVVQQYHQTCDEVIQRYAGFVPQHLGDGVLAYFGYPTAHEDDAQRAVRAGMEIVDALRRLSPSPSQGEGSPSNARTGEGHRQVPSQETPYPLLTGARGLPARIGIHTGLVVVGKIGGANKELLALGETPNVAARIQGLAEPNTVILSAATHRLVNHAFECQPFGSHRIKGLDTPIAVYHVQSERQQVSPLAGRGALTARPEFIPPWSPRSHLSHLVLNRLKGDLLLKFSAGEKGDRETRAELLFEKAIDIARKQSAKLHELQASTSLARLWQQQGKHDAAHNMLSEVYHWFTEGFDTKDLQEVKTLLEELV